MVVLVVLDGGVLDADAGGGEEFVEVVGVLVLLGLAEDDEAAAGLYICEDGVELVGVEAGGAGAGSPLEVGLGGMGDDEDVGAGEEV